MQPRKFLVEVVKSMFVACWLQGQIEQPKTESANPNKAALQPRHKSNHLQKAVCFWVEFALPLHVF